MITEFNFEVLIRKRFEIKEVYGTEIQYLKSILISDQSAKIPPSDSKNSSLPNSGRSYEIILGKSSGRSLRTFRMGKRGFARRFESWKIKWIRSWLSWKSPFLN
jgi:hypothetical protein